MIKSPFRFILIAGIERGFFMKKFISVALFCAAIVVFSSSSYAVKTRDAVNTLDAAAPFEDLIQITPSDATVYDPPLRGCIAETAGDIAFNPIKSTSNVTVTVLKGQLVPVLTTQILATGTTATVVCGR